MSNCSVFNLAATTCGQFVGSAELRVALSRTTSPSTGIVPMAAAAVLGQISPCAGPGLV